MPSVIKRSTSSVAPRSFQIYTGDDPTPGGYRAVIKQLNMVKSSGDNLMFTPVVELLAKDGSAKSQFDGYAVWPQFPLTDKEGNMQREQSLYLAVCGKMDPDIKTDVDPRKFKKSDGQKAKVLTIGGVNPIGKIVNVKLQYETDNREGHEGEQQLKCDIIFAARDEADTSSGDQTDDEDEDEEETDEEGLPLYEEDDLKSKSIPALRKILVDEFEVEEAEAAALKQKAKLVAAILAAQEELDDDEEEPEDEEEDEEDDESDEDEEDEDDEEDPEEELRAELAELDRTELKARLKAVKPDAKVLKSHSDEDLLEQIVAAAPPF